MRVLLWLERPLGQQPEDLLQRQLRLGRAQVQSEQATLARPSPVNRRPAAPPGRCAARGTTRLGDSALFGFDSTHDGRDGCGMLAELMQSSVGEAKWWVMSTEDHIISVPPASSLHGDVVCQGVEPSYAFSSRVVKSKLMHGIQAPCRKMNNKENCINRRECLRAPGPGQHGNLASDGPSSSVGIKDE
jgi:hypothetical protein